MTRGQLAIITPEGKILTSTEFNGDIYYDGNGQDAYERIDSIDHVEEYEDFIQEFNDDYYQYDSVETEECDDSFLDMQTDYFVAEARSDERHGANTEFKWFSDYVYIKNLSEKSVVITDANGKKLSLNSDITAVFNFGEFVAASLEDFETRNFINELNGKKDDLSYDVSQNYSKIWNACADYDNNHHGSYLTDRIQEHDFVDEEVLEYIVKERSTDLCSLRNFIGGTYDADLYILDGYGNLRNVEKDDFESLIDDLIYELNNNIYIPTAKKEACL